MSRRIEGGRRVLRLLGTFDGEAADELQAHIRGERERDIVVDVTFVRGFDVDALSKALGVGGRPAACVAV